MSFKSLIELLSSLLNENSNSSLEVVVHLVAFKCILCGLIFLFLFFYPL